MLALFKEKRCLYLESTVAVVAAGACLMILGIPWYSLIGKGSECCISVVGFGRWFQKLLWISVVFDSLDLDPELPWLLEFGCAVYAGLPLSG